MSDKPEWLRNRPTLTEEQIRELDVVRRKQLETLLAVDEAVREIVRTLHQTGRLRNTLIIFTSDNGQFWGEHRLDRKSFPYEESIRVPLVVRYDPLTDPPSHEDALVANVDLAATIADIAGVPAPGSEGMSLSPLLQGASPPWRNFLLIEHLSFPSDIVPKRDETYCAVRSESHLYALYASGEEELYDLSLDPFQLENVASSPAAAGTLATHRAALKDLCDPPPPGLIVPY